MKPYYESDSITLYNEDCLSVLKNFSDNMFDVVITSPPYNKQHIGGKLVGKVIYDNVFDNMPEAKYQKWQKNVLNECYRVSNQCFYNHKVRYVNYKAIHPMEWILKTNWILNQEIVWNRQITGNIRGWRLWNIDERIYWLTKNKTPELPQKVAQYTSVWNIPPERKNEHPAPFPIEIPKRCIDISSADSVLDPFAGSGTTLMATLLDKSRKIMAIGIEKSERYCEMIAKRVENFKEDAVLWN